jgi:hypothetical protein
MEVGVQRYSLADLHAGWAAGHSGQVWKILVPLGFEFQTVYPVVRLKLESSSSVVFHCKEPEIESRLKLLKMEGLFAR